MSSLLYSSAVHTGQSDDGDDCKANELIIEGKEGEMSCRTGDRERKKEEKKGKEIFRPLTVTFSRESKLSR